MDNRFRQLNVRPSIIPGDSIAREKNSSRVSASVRRRLRKHSESLGNTGQYGDLQYKPLDLSQMVAVWQTFASSLRDRAAEEETQAAEEGLRARELWIEAIEREETTNNTTAQWTSNANDGYYYANH